MKLLPKETYCAMIRASIGTEMFRTLYAEVDGKKEDLLKGGELSCTFFVSSVLWHFRLLVEGPHANTIPGFVRDLEKSGWTKTDSPREGDIVIWEKMPQKNGEHPHSGFYIDQDTAISHSDSVKTPVRHHLTFGTTEDGGPQRAIMAVYTNSSIHGV